MATALTCPKCHGEMRNYERNGIHIDQCSECRGVFLDRGELEHLMAAEAAYSAPAPAPAQQQAPAPQEYRQQEYRQQEYRQPEYRQQKPYKKKSLLSELFD